MLDTWQDNIWPEVKSSEPMATGEGVLDPGAFATIEVDKLFDAVNYAATTVGQAVLYRSLAQPLDNIDEIKAKQDAVAELRDNPELKAALAIGIQNAANAENDFYKLLFGEYPNAFDAHPESPKIEGYGYLQYKKGSRFLVDLVRCIQAISPPRSPYLQNLFGQVNAFAHSRPYALMRGPVFLSEHGLQSKEERKGSFVPAIIFTPRIFKPLFLAIVFLIYWLISHFAPSSMREAVPDAAIFLTPLLLLYFPLIGNFDRDNCINPLRRYFKSSPEVAEALESLGQLDELLSFLKLAETISHPVVLPTFIGGEHHQINLTDAKNPVLAKLHSDYVGNDFVLEHDKLVFITGPNSGGKTAFCKTLTQIQVLAQTGCFIPAQAATLTVADRVFYQAPEISHLSDGEGRFGTELKRTKDIFLASTAKSLVVLDEMSEGTTFEEKMESSANILGGFYRKGNSTVLITHNHQLVDVFVQQGTGLAKQVEFADDAPTYKLIAGISRVSHADRVAKKIGFSKEDIDHYLEDSP